MAVWGGIKSWLDHVSALTQGLGLSTVGLGEGPHTHVLETVLQSIQGMNKGLKSDILEYDPFFMWRVKPHGELDGERADERGMLGGPYPMVFHKESRPIRILVLAASSMVCGRPPLFRRLADRVSEEQSEIQLINGAVPGYTSVQMLNYLSHLFPFYKPTHVMLGSTWTDSWPRVLLEDSMILRVLRQPVWKGGRAGEWLGRLIMYMRWRLRHDGPRVPLWNYWRTLNRVIDFCRRRGSVVAFFSWPVYFQIEPMQRLLRLHGIPWLPDRYLRYRSVFLSLERYCPLCDCNSLFEDNPGDYFESDGQHLNDVGLDHCAEFMSRFIIDKLCMGSEKGK